MAKELSHHTDPWSLAVIALTLILFLVALFAKGFTHDLLLETGVFLVSVKLIIMGYKISATAERTDEHLQQLQSFLHSMDKRSGGQGQSTSNRVA